jgi:hypothetical protein
MFKMPFRTHNTTTRKQGEVEGSRERGEGEKLFLLIDSSSFAVVEFSKATNRGQHEETAEGMSYFITRQR